MTETMKQKIKAFAMDLGVDDVGFAAVSDYNSPSSPPLTAIFPGAKTLIVLAYREASHCESENMRIAMTGRMAIMEFMATSSYKVSHFLERTCRAKGVMTPTSYPANISPEAKFGLIADISHRHAAIAAGLMEERRAGPVLPP